MNLKLLSNTELDTKLKHLVLQERKLLHIILAHIHEVERRQLYLSMGRKCLFDYLTLDLGYSNGPAQRRLEAAKILGEVPKISQQIEAGAVTLSQVGELARAIKEKQKQDKVKVSALHKENLLTKIANKNGYETQKILAQELNLQLRPMESKRAQKDGSVQIQTSLSKERYEKLLKCQDFAAAKLLKDHGSLQLCDVLDVLFDHYLADQQGTSGTKKNTFIKNKERKTLTPLLRKLILQRDQFCQHVDPISKQKCQSTFALEPDHIIPRWAGGGNHPDNLRALCSRHNKLRYQEQSGVRKVFR